jgi:hypothetical protein
MTEQITDNPDIPRSFETRNLSTGIPKPNIVRIEVLDGNARQRYLGTLQRFGDREIKQNLYDNIAGRGDSVFFGFLKHAANQSLNMTAKWNTTGGSGNILGGVKKFASSVTGINEESMTRATDVMQALTGISAQSTGSSSLKQFGEVDLTSFTIECGWYLPEQFNLCVKSLKVLTRMVYPRQIDEKEFAKIFPELAVEGGKKVIRALKNATDSSSSTAENINIKTHADPGVVEELSLDLLQLGTRGFNAINSLFGRNLTFDPLPVRLSVGQYMDIEPLVINGIKIGFSKETFVSDSGRHIPIMCDVSIGFDFWLKPAPKLEFMSLLGQEMFGTESTTNSVNNTDKKKSIGASRSF